MGIVKLTPTLGGWIVAGQNRLPGADHRALLVALLLGLLLQTVTATNCTYREDSLGNNRYRCADGKSGTLREDALGNIKDSGTGITWRKDALGNLKGSDGTLYREDSLGNVRGSNSKSGKRVTWRKDSLGNLRASDGSICRSNSLGYLRCDGQSTPPTLFEGE
ncbi:hypothetical protein [Aeromonas caviae]|uniref:hypothetical protein n=1 Tax=Aeromonas caviae TaxID=648 RepID=UPI001F3F8FF6|nr:hypothetical protein [Aeromonas caviae]